MTAGVWFQGKKHFYFQQVPELLIAQYVVQRGN